MDKHDVYCAVDPDLTKSGVAVIMNGEYFDVCCLRIWDLFDYLLDLRRMAEEDGRSYVIFVEDANLVRGTWHKHGQQNVGKGKAVCRLICDFCEAKGLNVQTLKPSGYSEFFKNADTFRRNTGWAGRVNEDARAAAAMIFKFRTRG